MIRDNLVAFSNNHQQIRTTKTNPPLDDGSCSPLSALEGSAFWQYYLPMPRAKPYYYLVDGLTDEKALIIKKGLDVIVDVKEVQVSVGRSMVETLAFRDVEEQVRLACDVASVHFRSRARL